MEMDETTITKEELVLFRKARDQRSAKYPYQAPGPVATRSVSGEAQAPPPKDAIKLKIDRQAVSRSDSKQSSSS